jgi:hypothetical protein
VVDVNWGISCSPVRATVNTTRSNIRKPNSLITSINENDLLQHTDILIYPTPTQNKLHVEVLNNITDSNIFLKILNTLGEQVLEDTIEKNVNGFTKQLELKHLSKGMYILTINAGKAGIVQKRFVIQ